MAIRSGRVGVRPDQVDAYGRIKNNGGGGGTIDVDGALSTTSTNPVQNRVITNALNEKVNANALAQVATTGDYGDLLNKPDIPTKTSDLTNDSGFLTSAPVLSVNNKTGAVVLTASDVGAMPSGGNVVISVNSKTGAVVLSASDIGAVPVGTDIVNTVNGNTGTVTVPTIPAGGGANYVLCKNSANDYDCYWNSRTLASLAVKVFTTPTISSLPYTMNASGVSPIDVVVNSVLSKPSAQTGDWTITTGYDSITISGSISGSTTVTLYLETM